MIGTDGRRARVGAARNPTLLGARRRRRRPLPVCVGGCRAVRPAPGRREARRSLPCGRSTPIPTALTPQVKKWDCTVGDSERQDLGTTSQHGRTRRAAAKGSNKPGGLVTKALDESMIHHSKARAVLYSTVLHCTVGTVRTVTSPRYTAAKARAVSMGAPPAVPATPHSFPHTHTAPFCPLPPPPPRRPLRPSRAV